jgi:hypothetical protein
LAASPGARRLIGGLHHRLELCISGVAGSQVGRTAGHVPLSSRRYPQRGALITTPERWCLACCGDDHDIAQFLAPGSMVIRTPASAATSSGVPPHRTPTRPPCCQADLARPAVTT